MISWPHEGEGCGETGLSEKAEGVRSEPIDTCDCTSRLRPRAMSGMPYAPSPAVYPSMRLASSSRVPTDSAPGCLGEFESDSQLCRRHRLLKQCPRKCGRFSLCIFGDTVIIPREMQPLGPPFLRDGPSFHGEAGGGC